jgi:hypothetical protein
MRAHEDRPMKRTIAAMLTLIGLAFTTGALAAGPVVHGDDVAADDERGDVTSSEPRGPVSTDRVVVCAVGFRYECNYDVDSSVVCRCVSEIEQEREHREVVRPGEGRGDVTPGEPNDAPELDRTPLCESGYYSVCDFVDGELVCSCRLEEV